VTSLPKSLAPMQIRAQPDARDFSDKF